MATSEERREDREREQAREEELTVTDKRRFTPEGELRPDSPEVPEAFEDGAIASSTEVLPPEDRSDNADGTPENEMVPRAEAEHWQQRAIDAESKLQAFAEGFDRYKREHDAVRTRLERDLETRVRESLGRTFSGVLDALDNLERALGHAEDNPLAEGVRLVHKQVLDILTAEGLERIDTLDRPFDPQVAEAVSVVPVEDASLANTVLEELRPGYRFRGKVLRAAQVRVGQASESTAAPEEG